MQRQFGALRGLAIILVVLNHSIEFGTWGPSESGYPAAEGAIRYILLMLRQLGLVAVPMFLFISGAFFAYAAAGSEKKLTWRPALNGLKRVLWPYLVWSLVFYIFVYAWRSEQYTLWGYATNLIVGYPFNFVPLLVFWYLTSPLLVRILDRRGGLFLGLLVVYQLILLNIQQPFILGFPFPDGMHILIPKVIGKTMAEWGLFFPLGLYCGLKMRSLNPSLLKWRWAFLGSIGVLYVLNILTTGQLIWAPLTEYVYPMAFVFFIPTIKRETIPLYKLLEEVGKKSYGLYLMNLICLSLVLIAIRGLFPALLNFQGLIQVALFIGGLAIPLVFMSLVERFPVRNLYRYMFGN